MPFGLGVQCAADAFPPPFRRDINGPDLAHRGASIRMAAWSRGDPPDYGVRFLCHPGGGISSQKILPPCRLAHFDGEGTQVWIGDNPAIGRLPGLHVNGRDGASVYRSGWPDHRSTLEFNEDGGPRTCSSGVSGSRAGYGASLRESSAFHDVSEPAATAALHQGLGADELQLRVHAPGDGKIGIAHQRIPDVGGILFAEYLRPKALVHLVL